MTKELLSPQFNLQDLQVISNQLTSVPRLLNVVFSAFSTVIAFFSLLVMTFYLLMERPKIHRYLMWMFEDRTAEKKAEDYVMKIEEQIGSWVRGELLLMFVVGILTYVGLLLLGIPYALPLAIIAGLLELLPNIGPTVAAVPAVVVAYINSSPTMALAVLAWYVLVQQLENNFIVPYIMKRAVGLNPIATIFLLLVGFRLAGVGGAVLVIPIFLVAKVVVSEIYRLKKS
jgi:predicted PurR-regulated permease PerM